MVRFRPQYTNLHGATLAALVAVMLSSPMPAVALDATLEPSIVSPAPLGTPVRFTASVGETDGGGTIWYRFRVRPPGGDYRMVRDFGPEAVLDWASASREGAYDIELTVRNLDTGDSLTTVSTVELTSRTDGTTPVVSETTHPLVFLYSAPPCEAGGRMHVEFQGPDGLVHSTPSKACEPAFSTNFYLAGLYQDTAYAARHIVECGLRVTSGEPIAFATGAAAPDPYPTTVLTPASASASNPILLGNASGAPTATDLKGAVVWYTTGIQYITRAERDGYFWTLTEGEDHPSESFVRKFDLTGVTVLETNAARVNEQLRAMGKREISGFHHEVATLPDGRIAALAGVEQMLTDVQGPGTLDVLGDMIVVFDSELNVVWAWDAFDHLDVRRAALLGETCGLNTGGCPTFYLAEQANDWTHGNSVQLTPDGQLLFSARHQDWVVKIDYSDALGDGHVIWRLGKDGDFQIASGDSYPWFSHQHDANFDPSDPSAMLVFDNGNTRVANSAFGNSRGQVLRLDEERRVATLTLNADLGVLAPAVGSAQKLTNGNYHFDAGYVPEADGIRAYAIEVDAAGNIVFNATFSNLSYRSFRMTDMYTPQ